MQEQRSWSLQLIPIPHEMYFVLTCASAIATCHGGLGNSWLVYNDTVVCPSRNFVSGHESAARFRVSNDPSFPLALGCAAALSTTRTQQVSLAHTRTRYAHFVPSTSGGMRATSSPAAPRTPSHPAFLISSFSFFQARAKNDKQEHRKLNICGPPKAAQSYKLFIIANGIRTSRVHFNWSWIWLPLWHGVSRMVSLHILRPHPSLASSVVAVE